MNLLKHRMRGRLINNTNISAGLVNSASEKEGSEQQRPPTCNRSSMCKVLTVGDEKLTVLAEM